MDSRIFVYLENKQQLTAEQLSLFASKFQINKNGCGTPTYDFWYEGWKGNNGWRYNLHIDYPPMNRNEFESFTNDDNVLKFQQELGIDSLNVDVLVSPYC